jgi:hypothetical protein
MGLRIYTGCWDAPGRLELCEGRTLRPNLARRMRTVMPVNQTASASWLLHNSQALELIGQYKLESYMMRSQVDVILPNNQRITPAHKQGRLGDARLIDLVIQVID